MEKKLDDKFITVTKVGTHALYLVTLDLVGSL